MILLGSILSVPGLLVVISFGAILFAFIVYYNDSSHRRNYYQEDDYDYYDAYQTHHRNRPPTYYPPYPTPYQLPQWVPPSRSGYAYDPYYERYDRRVPSTPWGVFFIAFILILIVMAFIMSQNNEADDNSNNSNNRSDQARIGISLKNEPNQVPKNQSQRTDYMETRVYDNTKTNVYQSFNWYSEFTVQAGCFGQEFNAGNYKATLEEKFDFNIPVEILTIVNEFGKPLAYRVFIGNFPTRQEAAKFGQDLTYYGFEAGIPFDLSAITYRNE